MVSWLGVEFFFQLLIAKKQINFEGVARTFVTTSNRYQYLFVLVFGTGQDTTIDSRVP